MNKKLEFRLNYRKMQLKCKQQEKLHKEEAEKHAKLDDQDVSNVSNKKTFFC